MRCLSPRAPLRRSLPIRTGTDRNRKDVNPGPQGTAEGHGNRHTEAGMETYGPHRRRSREARKREDLGTFTRVKHAATPFGPKACTFRSDFAENGPILVHGGPKRGRVFGVNRRPLLLSTP